MMSHAVNRVHAGLANGTKGAASPVRLPPMLSPTLPAWVDEIVPDGDVPNLPQRMLSPTLPPMFDSLGSDVEVEMLSRRKDAPKKANGAASLPPKPIKRKPSVMVVLPVPRGIKSKVLELVNGDRGRTRPVGLGITNGADRRAKEAESKKRSINWSYSSSSEDEGNGRKRKSRPAPLEKAKKVGQKKPPKLDEPAKAAKLEEPASVKAKTEGERGTREHGEKKPIEAKRPPKKTDSSPVKRPERAPSAASTPQTPTLDSDQREKYYKLLRSKMHGWVVVAQDKKHEADKATMSSQRLLSAAVLMDSTVAFLIGFDYEDKADMMIRGHLQPKSWSTLLPYLGRLAKVFEKQNSRHMMGLAFQLRAIVHLKIASIHQAQLRRLMSQDEKPSEGEIPKLTNLYMAMHDGALQDFKWGATELPLEAIEKEYPKTWAHRARAIQPTPKHEGGLRPNEDPYCLPVHTYTSVREVAAFGYSMMKEWAEKNNIKCEWALNKLSQ